jgi:hypothetical protein
MAKKCNDKTYAEMRELAIRDAKRKLSSVEKYIRGWNVVDKLNYATKKEFIYSIRSVADISLKYYSIIEQIKYIVWRFDVSENELRGAK